LEKEKGQKDFRSGSRDRRYKHSRFAGFHKIKKVSEKSFLWPTVNYSGGGEKGNREVSLIVLLTLTFYGKKVGPEREV